MDIKTTANELKTLVAHIVKDNPKSKLYFHQQEAKRQNMCVKGCGGTLYIIPHAQGFDISLAGKELTLGMTNIMNVLCGPRFGFKKPSNNPPSQEPFWRTTDYKKVREAVIIYAE